MKKRFLLLLIAALSLHLVPEDAEARAPRKIKRLLARSQAELWIEDGTLQGPGAGFLRKEAEKARFFLIGESHGNQETPALTRALFRDLGTRGYQAFAMETGPLSTPLLLTEGKMGGLEGMVRFMKDNPMSIAFLNWREEIEVVADALELGYEVWGLDQEFVGSGRLLLSRLIKLAPDEASRRLAEGWFERARLGFAAFAENGDETRGFMNVVTDEDFDALDRAFATANPEARAILAELRQSAAVYRHFQQERYYLNNRDRIRLMKRHLADRLAGEDGKVLFKFGSVHVGRGYSPYAQLDLGNMAAEVAVLSGSDSFHLYVFGRYSVGHDGSRRDFQIGAPNLEPMYELLEEGDRAAVFDLRPLRGDLSAPSLRKDHPELHDLVFRFDAVLLFPELHAATDLVSMPGED